MPSCAAPCATKVATSNARTRIRSMPGSVGREAQRAAVLVAERGFGVDSGACEQRHASARMRPLGTAMMIGSVMSERGFTWGCSRAQQTQRSAERAGMSSEENNRGAFLIQEHYLPVMGAPIYARICAALATGLNRESRSARACSTGRASRPRRAAASSDRRPARARSRRGRAAPVSGVRRRGDRTQDPYSRSSTTPSPLI